MRCLPEPCLVLCSFLMLNACAPASQQVEGSQDPPADSRVAAVLEHLPPDLMVIDGDPIETTTIDALMRKHNVPGVSVAVVRDGTVDWSRGFGVADAASGQPVTRETLFQAASINKPGHGGGGALDGAGRPA